MNGLDEGHTPKVEHPHPEGTDQFEVEVRVLKRAGFSERDIQELQSRIEPLMIVECNEVPLPSLLFEGRVRPELLMVISRNELVEVFEAIWRKDPQAVPEARLWAERARAIPDLSGDVRDVLAQIASGWQPDVEEPTGDEVKARQTQLTELIRIENTRLNRLIINLYLKFTLEPVSDENVLDSVCHSVAEYFHADACELLLLHREADEQSSTIRQELRLYGAFGPWERAIHSQFVRRRRPIRYCLPAPGREEEPGNTMYFFRRHEPVAMEHRGRFRDAHDRPVDDTAEDDVPHQEVWLNFDLASTCRNILGGSLRRPHARDNDALADGVLKVENRRPRHLSAFQQGGDHEFYFTPLWRCAAVRPYIRYLAKTPRIHQSTLNDVGWQRRYDEVVGGVPLFWDFRAWYANDNDEGKRQLKSKKAKELKGPFGDLVRFATGAETFIQHLAEGLRYALGVELLADEARNLLRNVPSLFNMANIARAWSWVQRKSDHTSAQWIAEHRRQLHGIFSPGLWAPENLDSESGIKEILEGRRDSILNTLGWDAQTGSLDAILNDSLTNNLNYCGAIREILLTLRNCAEMLTSSVLVRENPNGGRSRPHLLVRTEYRRLRRCVEEVLRRTEAVRLPPKETPSLTSAPSDRRTALAAAFDTLMETVAVATMGSHTFGRADTARLLFISRRVDQLLDNRTIALAQSRGIPVCHDDIARLRIDEFALECLERIKLSAGAIVRLLRRALQTWAGRRFPDKPLPEISASQLDLRAFLQCAEDCAAGRRECKDGIYSHPLVWVTAELRDIEPWPESDVTLLFTSLVESSRQPWSVWLGRGKVEKKIPVDLYVNLAPGEGPYRTTDWLQAVANSMGQLRKQLVAWIDRAEEHKTVRLGPCEGTAAAQPILESDEQARSDAGPIERLAELRKKLDRVMLEAGQGRSDEEPHRKDEDFLDLIDGPLEEGDHNGPLSELCDAIAEFIGCDSCAIFFSSPQRRRSQRGENEPETTMRMRAASGRLRKTLQAWRDARKEGNANSVGGINYGSLWKCKRQKQCDFQLQCEFQVRGELQKRCKLQEGSREELEKHMRGDSDKNAPPWPLTNQIWHLGEGRFASSRDEFRHAALREFSGGGCGDQYAYPPDGKEHPDDAEWTLKAIFRNLVGIPIFTRGGRTEYVPMRDDEWWDRDATRTEFHSCYRVVGILKLEGKRPNLELLKDPGCPWWAALTVTARQKLIRVLGDGKESVAKERAPDVLRHLYDFDRDEGGFGKKLLSDGQGSVDSEFVDALTDALDARWDPEEIELLVAIAMELGRLLTLRTLHEATAQRIVLGENDIGLLDVRLRDIDDILLMNHAAERVYAKVEHELCEIAAGLEDEQRKSLRGGALSGPELHKSVVAISGRKKTYSSLFAKLVRKELLRSGEGTQAVSVPPKEARWASIGPDGSGPYLDLGGRNELSSPERKVHGHASLLVQRRDLWQPAPGDEPPGADITVLAADFRMGGENVKVYHRREPETPPSDAPFVVRMLSQLGYGLVDFAGVRVVCGFLSDIERLLQAMRIAFRTRGICFDESEVDRWLECAQAGGYRGVHVTVRVPLKGLMREEDHAQLVDLFTQYGDDGGRLLLRNPEDTEPTVLFPCEIQLRTAYQDSWARASHEIHYKRPGIREDLHEHMHSLSGLLFNSDEIMDLVREAIEAHQPRHVGLLKHLRGRLYEDAFSLVQFAAEYAREFHKDDRLYGGRPHYNHLLSAADCLVRSFRVDDPLMLLLAFFQDLWMNQTPRVLVERSFSVGGLAEDSTLQMSILQELKQHFDEHATSALAKRLRGGLPKDWPCHQTSEASSSLAFGVVPRWFPVLLANCLRGWQAGTDELSNFRLRVLAEQVKSLREFGDQSEEDRGTFTEMARDLERRGCVLETAIQLSRLEELPSDPHRPRAIREFQEIYQILERIRRRIGHDMRLVLREAERMLRATADQLEAHLPIDWEA